MCNAANRRGSWSFIVVMKHCLLLLIVWSAFAITTARGDRVPVLKEYQIKAAFLYNFGKYVEWPKEETQADSSTNSFVIAVFGKNPFGADLESIVKGRTINNRQIRIVYMNDPNRLEFCHILFVPTSEGNAMPKLLSQLASKPVLTVGESNEFKAGGGMVVFVVEGDKVRFDIQASAAQQAGLKISAQLQKLARNSK